MIDFPIINKIIVFLINAFGFWLAFLVYYSNPKERINKIFISMVVLMFFWVDGAYFARIIAETQIELAHNFLKIAWFSTPLLFLFLYLLVIHLLEKEKKYKILNAITIFFGTLVAFIAGFTDLIIKDIKFVNESFTIIYGKGMFLFLIVGVFLIFITLYPLLKGYFQFLSEQKKRRIEYFLIGIIIFYLANGIFNIIFPVFSDITRFYYFGDYSTIFLLFFTALAITRRELFGVRVVLASIFVVLIAILLALDALLFTQVLTIQALKGVALAIFIVFGWMLIKSVSEEVKRREELEKLSRAKSEFISMASHQLRTPLTAIKGYTSLMIEGTYGKVEPKNERVLKNILISSERLIKIVNDLLNLSRVELGKLELDKKPTKIEKLVEEVYQEVRLLAKAKNIEFVLEKPEIPLPELNIDPLKIRQVISNLVDNAIKYTDKGKVSIKIEKIRSRVRITISDTGRGFSEEEKSKLFQLFVRGEAGIDSFIEGTGIGLNVAKKFIELHKGTIYTESPGKDKGAIFWFELPIEKENNNKLLDYLSQE